MVTWPGEPRLGKERKIAVSDRNPVLFQDVPSTKTTSPNSPCLRTRNHAARIKLKAVH